MRSRQRVGLDGLAESGDCSSVASPVSVRSCLGAEARLFRADQTASLTSGVISTRSWASRPTIQSVAHEREASLSIIANGWNAIPSSAPRS